MKPQLFSRNSYISAFHLYLPFYYLGKQLVSSMTIWSYDIKSNIHVDVLQTWRKSLWKVHWCNHYRTCSFRFSFLIVRCKNQTPLAIRNIKSLKLLSENGGIMKSHFPPIHQYVFHLKKCYIVTLLQVDKIQFIFLQSISSSLFITVNTKSKVQLAIKKVFDSCQC